MSVFIKNLKMPKNCDTCNFFDDRWDYPNCIVTGTSQGYNFNAFENKMPNCPLIEIKDVDLVKLLDLISQMANK